MLHWNDPGKWRYPMAIAAVAVAVLVRLAVHPWFQSDVPFITLFVAVAAVVWLAGRGPAIVTALTGLVACALLFLPPRLRDGGLDMWLVLLVYGVAVGLMILLVDYGHRRRGDALLAVEALTDREAQLRLMVDALPMLIAYIDRNLRYRFNNLTYQRWFGQTPEALQGRHVQEVLGQQVFEQVEPAMRRALAGEPVHFESPLDYRAAGSRQVSVTYVPDAAGSEVRGFFALVEDVTERRGGELARAHLAAIFDSAGDAVVSKDLEGRVTSWNAGAERLFGYSAAEMMGQPISRLIPPDLEGEELGIMARIRDGAMVQHMETERLTRDGQRVPVSVTVSPIRDANGRIIGASKIARNITKRRDAMRALQQSEARFRTLADNAPMLIWRADECNKGTWFNRYWLEFTGRTLEQELGDGWVECIHPDERERVFANCAEHSARREPFEMEFRMRRHDGAYRWVLDRGAPVFDGPNGEFNGYIGSSIDITERKQAVEQLAQAHRRKDEFLATLAHELRNPLAPILNAAQYLRQHPAVEPGPRTAVEIVERQARHMSRLVDDLLDVSRISRGKISLRREVLRLDQAVAAALETSRPSIESAGHELRLDLAADVYVDGDLTRLSQVFGNLLNNAVKYMPARGVIEVRVGGDEQHATASVRDTGIGLPPQALEQVFEMFTQVGAQNQRQDGLGIGLHIARQLVQLHGGTIEARSAGEGQGTEFVVTLPRVQRAAPAADRPLAAARAQAPRLRLLLVDDNADVRRSVAMMLEMEGHEVHVAQDGLEGVEAFERLQPDLVLMDIGMPRMNGYEAARRIRALPGGQRIRLVALTGWGQEEDRRLAMDAGFDEHWTKPIEYETLRRVVAGGSSRGRDAVAGTPPAAEAPAATATRGA